MSMIHLHADESVVAPSIRRWNPPVLAEPVQTDDQALALHWYQNAAFFIRGCTNRQLAQLASLIGQEGIDRGAQTAEPACRLQARFEALAERGR